MSLVNSYAVVAYINGSLAKYIDTLRREVTPGCPHHAHITILPPRPLYIPEDKAVEQCRDIVSRFHPFDVELGEIDLFPVTEVIKIRVEKGVAELRTLHDILNTGPFEQVEDFEYVPHVTLAQELPSTEKVRECLDLVRARWARFEHDTALRIEALTFVQQSEDGRWHNLAELWLGRPQPVAR